MSILALGRSFFRSPASRPTVYFHALDLARGLAACSILVWHYQHLVALGTAPAGSRGGYPFYHLLRPFYEQGGSAVQLFWIISGFVFSAVYFGTKATTWQFATNRFGRLYPLHFVTLLAVALLQLANGIVFGHALLYNDNSPSQFALHLIMASGWTTPVSFTFNGPIWSVSAEILVYALFWTLNPYLFRFGIAGPAVAAVTCFALSFVPVLALVWLCGFYFFIGCAIFSFNRTLHALPRWRVGTALAVLGGAVLALRFVSQGAGTLALFVGTVMLLTSVNRLSSHALAQRLRWLGDSTYGIYLWHTPVQLAILLGLKLMGLGRGIVLTHWFFLLYVLLVLTVARLSFIGIERPMRGYIRQKSAALAGRRSAQVPV